MTIHSGELQAVAEATATQLGDLGWFDQIRALVVGTGLPPVPDVYDLFRRYVRDEDHALSLAIDAALVTGGIDLAAIADLRRAHCGDGGVIEVAALVEAAHDQAEALIQRIEAGRADLADYGRAIADGGARLSAPLDAAGLAVLLDQLSGVTATMQAANARLEGELADAALEARSLSEKLGLAESAAITYQLTGILNRRGTIEMLDIDHFKRFNDRFGQALGDEVLRFVARHVADRIGPRGGTVGRLGGEEFIAVLPDHDVQGAAAIIDKVRAELARQIIRNAGDGSSMGRVSFSAGVAGDHHDDCADSLIERADRALYTAKRLGRDRVVPDRG
jgi:diguanylate cyclase